MKNSYYQIVPFFYKWEGGLSRDTNDSASAYPCPTPYKDPRTGKIVSGWHTNKGITYKTWVSAFGTQNDHRFLTMGHTDWGVIFKAGYWDKVKGDDLPEQYMANVAVSWAWGSGAVTAIKQLQRACGLPKKEQDGIIGRKTIKALEDKHKQIGGEAFFKHLCDTRESFFRFISDEKNGITTAEKKRYKNNSKFLKGWLNRLDNFRKTFAPK